MGDPFASSEQNPYTFARPNPSAWLSGQGPSHRPAPQQHPNDDSSVAAHGINPLLRLANRLLLLLPQIRHTGHVADPAALRLQLAQEVREFTDAAQAAGMAPERVSAARYVLCTMLDEAASDTPWGGQGAWAQRSLLAEFHGEVFGGEKVFQLMARLAQQPSTHIELLELIYAGLALGFEGRYRVIDGGRMQLDAVRARLAQIIRTERGPAPAAMAPNWPGHPVAQKRALGWAPLAATAALTLLLLGALYVWLSQSLGERVAPVLAAIHQLKLAPPVAVVTQPAPAPRLAPFLAPEVQAGLVSVRDDADRSIVTVRGDGLFAPGSAELLLARQALMQRIGAALARVEGAVLVTGHTDSTPMRSSLFPSNWHLSQERARTVRDLLIAAGVPGDRVRAEGRADAQPVESGDSAAARAANRRVEVTLYAPASNTATASATNGAAHKPPSSP